MICLLLQSLTTNHQSHSITQCYIYLNLIAQVKIIILLTLLLSIDAVYMFSDFQGSHHMPLGDPICPIQENVMVHVSRFHFDFIQTYFCIFNLNLPFYNSKNCQVSSNFQANVQARPQITRRPWPVPFEVLPWCPHISINVMVCLKASFVAQDNFLPVREFYACMPRTKYMQHWHSSLVTSISGTLVNDFSRFLARPLTMCWPWCL